MPLVTAIAVGVGLLCMYKVHQFSEPEPVITVNGLQAPEQFNLKRITYEVFGNAGNGGKLVYIDIDGHPHQVDFTALPWSHTETTTLSVASGSISVHVRSGQVSCRMLVDGVVRDEQSDDHPDADVECRVKSA